MVLIGRNPLKEIPKERDSADITVTTVTYIPALEGYWEQSLDVLKLCLGSLLRNTREPFDLMVFDNGSCEEARRYLSSLHAAGKIQYLILSDANVGKAAAVNFMFGAAPGRYVAYTDSDVLFYPHWLEESIKVLNTFDRAGMVSGLPFRPPGQDSRELFEANVALAESLPGVAVERGDLIPGEYLSEHARSLGYPLPTVEGVGCRDLKVTKAGVSAFGFGSHFQYVTTREVIRASGPLQVGATGLSKHELSWDHRISELNLLRLALVKPYVRHLGNTLQEEDLIELERVAGSNIPERRMRDAPRLSPPARFFSLLIKIGLFRRVVKRLERSMYEGLSHHSRKNL